MPGGGDGTGNSHFNTSPRMSCSAVKKSLFVFTGSPTDTIVVGVRSGSSVASGTTTSTGVPGSVVAVRSGGSGIWLVS